MAENANEWHQKFCPLLGLHKSIGAKFVVIRDLHGPNTQARASLKVSASLPFSFSSQLLLPSRKDFERHVNLTF
jgi:hypothetical protein